VILPGGWEIALGFDSASESYRMDEAVIAVWWHLDYAALRTWFRTFLSKRLSLGPGHYPRKHSIDWTFLDDRRRWMDRE
jgi:hypothetical protein